MSDESDDKPTYQVNVTRVQEGILLIDADSADEAIGIAESDLSGADWETVHWQANNAELSAGSW